MNKILPLLLLQILILINGVTRAQDCTIPVEDKRGKMQPWSEGASQTGTYRNLFLEAGYSQEAIDDKLEMAYHDLFKGPDRVYFEVEDSLSFPFRNNL